MAQSQYALHEATMSMSPAQQADLDATKAQVAKIRENAYSMLLYMVRSDVKIENCGYKSLEDATRKIILSAHKEAEKVLVAHEKAVAGLGNNTHVQHRRHTLPRHNRAQCRWKHDARALYQRC